MDTQPSGESLSRLDHKRVWEDLVRLGLCEGIRSMEDYNRYFFRNIELTRQQLTSKEFNLDIPSAAFVMACHKSVFGDIYPWAGELRKKSLGIGGRIGADHPLLVANLEMAKGEAEALRSMSWDPIHIAAFYHVRFELVHPFRDGNGRVGRLMLAAQIQNWTGRHMHPPLEAREQYLDCMDHASWCGNLGPLVRLIEGWCGVRPDAFSCSGALLSPFRLSPRFLASGEHLKTLSEEIENARMTTKQWADRAERYRPLRVGAKSVV